MIAVADLEAATARTAALFDRAPSWRGEHPGAGSANALFRLDNAYVELLAVRGAGPVGEIVRGALDERGEGLLALAFGCDDVAGFRRELALRGVELPEPTAGEGRDATTGAIRHWINAFVPLAATRGLPVFAIEHRSPAEALPSVPPAGDAAAAPSALDHVVVISGDADASAAVYGGLLGLRLALDRRFEKRGIRLLFFRVGGVTVEVGAPLSGGDPEAADRFGGLAYWVDDVDAARKRLAAADFDVSEVRAGHKPGTRVCSVRDGTCGVPTLLKGPD